MGGPPVTRESMSTPAAANALPLSSPRVDWRRWVDTFSSLIGLWFVFALFTILTNVLGHGPRFATGANMELILRLTAVVGIAAAGLTLYVGLLDRPGEPPAEISLKFGFLLSVLGALLLIVGYSYRFELRDIADRVLSELVPGHTASGGRVVEIARRRAIARHVMMADQREARELIDHVLVVVGNYDLHRGLFR